MRQWWGKGTSPNVSCLKGAEWTDRQLKVGKRGGGTITDRQPDYMARPGIWAKIGNENKCNQATFLLLKIIFTRKLTNQE